MPTPDFTLYHAPMTRSIRVRWTLEEMGLPYRLETVKFTRGDVGGAEYRQINPMQKIPAFRDGDRVLLESLAIVQYLVTKYGPTDLAVKPDEPGYGAWLEWLHFGEATMSMSVNLILAHTTLLPEEQRNPGLAKWARHEVDKHLNMIAERGLKGHDYLAADRFTAADISVVYMLYLLKLVKQFNGAPEPVRAYFDRVAAREAWRKASAD
ncbi:glutathione S-transferase family protein [Marinicauda algicola]|uniref:Glutathione S-transferase family protein n=1 Tax=Marinicauda algicola TaxID=2029849 RepID=A0A4S2H0K4_9PROT|nr:glutathione S-transferase family protein [Marinicauda algicola]TGY89016.1 glutathione S-transferase family protein [Marinicauda algicola]